MCKALRKFALLLILSGVAAPGYADDEAFTGLLLVASDNLKESVFAESVVLVTRHGHGGPVGVMLNRQLSDPLRNVFPNNDRLGVHDTLYRGGPVSTNMIVFLLRWQEQPASALHAFDDLYLSFSRQLIEQALERDDPTSGLKVFSGYAGWADDQLSKEIERGDWYVIEPTMELVFDANPDTLWQRLIKPFQGNWVEANPQSDEG